MKIHVSSAGSYRVPVAISSVFHTLVQPLHKTNSIRISILDLQEVGYGGMDWIDLAQDRDRWQARVNVAMSLQVP
jgi:hypothetical protein